MLSWIRRNKVLAGVVTAGVVGAVSYYYRSDEQMQGDHADTKEDGIVESVSAISKQAFEAAAAAMKANPNMNLSDQQRLQLYGLFKQAKFGQCKDRKPSMLDMVATAKWDAWKSVGSISSGAAMQNYAALVQEFSGAEPSSGNDQGGGDFSLATPVSTMQLSDGDPKSQLAWSKREEIFKFASEGELQSLKELLSTGAAQQAKDGVKYLDILDEFQRTPLHYAADREQVEVVKLLVGAGATVDMKDEDGMTALLTAVMCEHEDIVRVLVEAGADVNAEDTDGETPLSSSSGAVKAILEGATTSGS